MNARSTGIGMERWKRPFDLCATAALAIPLLPLWAPLAGAVALAIRLESPGPALYRQTRLGRGGRPFRMFKFRTMVEGAETRTGPVWAAWRDARVTRVGRFLRRWHIDELPQFANVIRGEMSLVGPRPERPELAARIERGVPGFSRRLDALPGIMGMAQALGRYDLDPRRKLEYDLRYIDSMSPWLDLKLCLLCARRVLRRNLALESRRAGRSGGGVRRRSRRRAARCVTASGGGVQ